MKLDNSPATDVANVKSTVEGIKIEVPVAGQCSQDERSDTSGDYSAYSRENIRRLSTESSELADGSTSKSELKFGSQSNDSDGKSHNDGDIPARPRAHPRKQNLEAVDEEELGIYEDTAEGDDLTDTEDISKLREKLKARALEKQKETNGTKDIKPAIENVNESNEQIKRQVPTIADYIKDNEEEKVNNLGAIFRRSRTMSEPKIGIGLSYMQSMDGDPEKEPISMGMELFEARNASRLALESREAMFQRAMTLLTTRCTSVRQGLNTADSKVPLGLQIPRYFYISQEKPTPMEPLKAWRGYNGNVYFEPLSIAHVKGPPKPVEQFEPSPRYTDRTTDRTSDRPSDQQRSYMGQQRAISDKGDRPMLESRSASRVTKSSQSSMRPTAMMDKQQVITRFNDSLQEDLVWLEGQDSTGSLAVRPKTQADNNAKRDILYNKERICKGSVVHKLFVENKSRLRPKLTVSGGKVTPPNATSPLLRAQTQYSLSSQRLTTNSPDLFHGNDSKLPPVYQIRAGRQENSANRAKSYNRPVTVTDMKPFVKYSPDVVVKFNTHQQANMA